MHTARGRWAQDPSVRSRYSGEPPVLSSVTELGLAKDEVHSWCVRLDVPSATVAGLYATLAHDERLRSSRLRFARDGRRFIVARGMLRQLLGRYLCVRPERVRFMKNGFGKPALSPEFGSRLRFNLSHSAHLALIAVATDAEVGVDVEFLRELPDPLEIAQIVFSAKEVAQWEGLPRYLRAPGFLSCWTKKEAYVKARGRGFALPSTSFSVPCSGGAEVARVRCTAGSTEEDPGTLWSFYTLQPAPGYVGALAIEGSGWRLIQRHLRALVPHRNIRMCSSVGRASREAQGSQARPHNGHLVSHP